MKAVEINKTGGPEVLEVKDISLDKPGPDQVTIEQKAIVIGTVEVSTSCISNDSNIATNMSSTREETIITIEGGTAIPLGDNI